MRLNAQEDGFLIRIHDIDVTCRVTSKIVSRLALWKGRAGCNCDPFMNRYGQPSGHSDAWCSSFPERNGANAIENIRVIYRFPIQFGNVMSDRESHNSRACVHIKAERCLANLASSP